MKTFPCWQLTGHTAASLEEILAMICDGLRWSVMLLEAQNRRKITHFIAACGRAFRAIFDAKKRLKLLAMALNQDLKCQIFPVRWARFPI